MMEEIRRFGSDAHLAGILCRPELINTRDCAAIFITAGLLHKPGPYRLYVDLSRRIAEAGIPALRFDVSGIGESGRRANGEAADRAALNDLREAMDLLADETVASRFILIGLCSGAEVAHRVACIDARVAGIVALDGYIPRTPRFYVHHYLPRLLSWRKWRDVIAASLRRRFGAKRDDAPDDSALMFWGDSEPDRAAYTGELETLSLRGVRQLQIFSGGSGDCSYARQYRDAFGGIGNFETIDVRFSRDADHMYILGEDRRALMHDILRWIKRHFMNDAQRVTADAACGSAGRSATRRRAGASAPLTRHSIPPAQRRSTR